MALELKNASFHLDFLKVFKPVREKVLRDVGEFLTKAVRKLLTNNYLGVNSGLLRSRTGSSFSRDKEKNLVLNFGTDLDYGIAYETGNWSGVHSRSITKKNYVSRAKPMWKGKSHRPFLTDTLKDNFAEVNRIVERGLKV